MFPHRDLTVPLYDPSRKCRDPYAPGVSFLDNPTEYVKARLRRDTSNRRQPGATNILDPKNPRRVIGGRFSEDLIAAVFPAATGASASAATGPVAV